MDDTQSAVTKRRPKARATGEGREDKLTSRGDRRNHERSKSFAAGAEHEPRVEAVATLRWANQNPNDFTTYF